MVPCSFADQRHILFYGACQRRHLPSAAARAPHPVAATADPSAASSSHSVTPRRARLAQQLASVEETLRRLEEQAGQPLPSAVAVLPSLPAARRRTTRSMRRASSSSDSSSSSSESEDDQPSVSHLARRLQVCTGGEQPKAFGVQGSDTATAHPCSPGVLLPVAQVQPILQPECLPLCFGCRLS